MVIDGLKRGVMGQRPIAERQPEGVGDPLAQLLAVTTLAFSRNSRIWSSVQLGSLLLLAAPDPCAPQEAASHKDPASTSETRR